MRINLMMPLQYQSLNNKSQSNDVNFKGKILKDVPWEVQNSILKNKKFIDLEKRLEELGHDLVFEFKKSKIKRGGMYYPDENVSKYTLTIKDSKTKNPAYNKRNIVSKKMFEDYTITSEISPDWGITDSIESFEPLDLFLRR